MYITHGQIHFTSYATRLYNCMPNTLKYLLSVNISKNILKEIITVWVQKQGIDDQHIITLNQTQS